MGPIIPVLGLKTGETEAKVSWPVTTKCQMSSVLGIWLKTSLGTSEHPELVAVIGVWLVRLSVVDADPEAAATSARLPPATTTPADRAIRRRLRLILNTLNFPLAPCLSHGQGSY